MYFIMGYRMMLRGFFIMLSLWLCALCAAPAGAESLEEAVAGCQPTAEFVPHSYPGMIIMGSTNNLRRGVGSAFLAQGKPIFIKGKVLDADCLPVTGAKVEMWQANASGVYLKMLNEEEDFSGSGRSYTNNLGEYSFITIMPGKPKEGGGAPHVNFTVNAGGKLSKFSTRMYFPDDPANAGDDDLQDAMKEYHPVGVKMARPGKDDIYIYNIQLPGK